MRWPKASANYLNWRRKIKAATKNGVEAHRCLKAPSTSVIAVWIAVMKSTLKIGIKVRIRKCIARLRIIERSSAQLGGVPRFFEWWV